MPYHRDLKHCKIVSIVSYIRCFRKHDVSVLITLGLTSSGCMICSNIFVMYHVQLYIFNALDWIPAVALNLNTKRGYWNSCYISNLGMGYMKCGSSLTCDSSKSPISEFLESCWAFSVRFSSGASKLSSSFKWELTGCEWFPSVWILQWFIEIDSHQTKWHVDSAV